MTYERAIFIPLHTAFTALEDELSALGERWSAVCSWVENYGAQLEALINALQMLNTEEPRLQQWLLMQEAQLCRMEKTDATRASVQEVLDMVKCLQVRALILNAPY